MTGRPPWWALLSALVAPTALIGGWLVAQDRQRNGYDPAHDTISALAREGLDHRWIMTAGLAVLGAAHVVTAAGLQGARPIARVALGSAGVATALVAVFAEPARGSSTAHAVFATIGFVLLVLWPALAARSGDAPWPIRPAAAFGVAALSAGLLIWFATTLASGPLGVSERVLTAQQALWPLVVVFFLRRPAIVDRHADRAHI